VNAGVVERRGKIYRTDAQPYSVHPHWQSFIQDDTAHQQTIYECLNSQDIHRLFESLHDEDA